MSTPDESISGVDGVSATVRRLPPGSVNAAELLDRLADKVTRGASASAVFGTPVERDGVTVIPVASGIYGFGGGTGWEAAATSASTRSGDGAAAGVVVRPVGFIEISGGTAVYKPLRDPLRDVVLPTAVLLAATTALRMLRVVLFGRRR
jgi:hypothetical protein